MAYLRNRDELTKELKREKPKKDIVLALSRRAEILADSLDVCVSSLLLDFPELWKPYVVMSTCSNTHVYTYLIIKPVFLFKIMFLLLCHVSLWCSLNSKLI